MPTHYYSVQTFLAWSLNHYFYGGRHFGYVGAPFHTYKHTNPSSSNPWHLYGAHYAPWSDVDPYDAHVRNARRGAEAGVLAQRDAGSLDHHLANVLQVVANQTDVGFLYPIVYRVDLDSIDPARLHKAGSGADTDSDEWLIYDLAEIEFDVLFFDPESDSQVDADVRNLGAPILGGPDPGPLEALKALWTRSWP